MGKIRQDGWTTNEDELLKQIVLAHIRAGNTQIRAFEKAGSQLNRTAAACGFRWNAFVRKQAEKEVEQAKQIRKNKHIPSIKERPKEMNTGDRLIEELIEKLQALYTVSDQTSEQSMESKLKEIEDENEMLRNRIKRYDEAWKEIGKVWNWINRDQPQPSARLYK